ncbi:MAG: single-stranded-DNA-specific exonuclease RecJ [Planctomycetota bacterium]|nr:single-stranded-DNA-specific exonuclease RecJ [Planctomycetota bacterium]
MFVVTAKWQEKPQPGSVSQELAKTFSVSHILATLVAQRVEPPTRENVASFLRPTLGGTLPPSLLNGMDRAADRLAQAVKDRQRVIVHGDYDADGVTASAVLIRACRAVGHSITCHLPSRFDDGYGISSDFVRKAVEEDVDLVVTVDCGTSEHENIRLLSENGIDVIVTDHHEPGDRGLPSQALAVINPKSRDSTYPFRDLTGVGVAFKLAWALYEKLAGSPRVGDLQRTTLLSLVPLVAIGTIADVAPLVGENRALVAEGLKRMRDSSPGISALLDNCRGQSEDLTTRMIAFHLSPRLNAAGRMGKANLALDLLVEDDPAQARQLALSLDHLNSERQTLCQVILSEASREAEVNHSFEHDPAVLVAREGWHEGVIGIVAGRLSEIYNRPAAVVSFPPGQRHGRGSARSAAGINLYRVMENSCQHLLSFGGHELAAGFTLERDSLEAFREAFLRECASQVDGQGFVPVLYYDMEIPFAEINHRLVSELDKLRPLGQGNPESRFLVRGLRVVGGHQLLRGNKRFFFNVSQDGIAYRAVVNNNQSLWSTLESVGRGKVDIVCTPVLTSSNFYHSPRLELQVDDLRPAAV